ncbi:MAG: hypothetical protein QE271_04655 [Bacteriovoracaceae bacterium]|nr:hypothetical protein [Bacteriovoracaceae bacterium]
MKRIKYLLKIFIFGGFFVANASAYAQVTGVIGAPIKMTKDLTYFLDMNNCQNVLVWPHKLNVISSFVKIVNVKTYGPQNVVRMIPRLQGIIDLEGNIAQVDLEGITKQVLDFMTSDQKYLAGEQLYSGCGEIRSDENIALRVGSVVLFDDGDGRVDATFGKDGVSLGFDLNILSPKHAKFIKNNFSENGHLKIRRPFEMYDEKATCSFHSDYKFMAEWEKVSYETKTCTVTHNCKNYYGLGNRCSDEYSCKNIAQTKDVFKRASLNEHVSFAFSTFAYAGETERNMYNEKCLSAFYFSSFQTKKKEAAGEVTTYTVDNLLKERKDNYDYSYRFLGLTHLNLVANAKPGAELAKKVSDIVDSPSMQCMQKSGKSYYLENDRCLAKTKKEKQ